MQVRLVIPVILILLTGCVTVSPKITPEMSPVKFSKPENSNATISGDRFPYVLWYDDTKWHALQTGTDLHREFNKMVKKHTGSTLNAVLLHQNMEISAFILDESRLRRSYEQIINDFKLRNSEHPLIKCEYREVNQNRILFFLMLSKDDDSIERTTSIYCLSNDKGSVNLQIITERRLYSEHENDILGLLNGLDFASQPEVKTTDHIGDDIELRLKGIKNLYEKGLITEEEYKMKKAEILESF